MRAAVIGNGNVAIDVARMLLLDPSELAATDVADHAIAAMAASAVREVLIIGRRGPLHAAFTTPEVREVGELNDVDVHVDPADVDIDIPADASPTRRRNIDLLRAYAQRPAGRLEHPRGPPLV